MGNNVGSNKNQTEIAKIISYLSKFEMFNDEKQASLMKIASVLQLCSFKKNDKIIEQGSEASCLYIIAEGKVSFSAFDPSTGLQQMLTTLGQGNTFGEFALVYDVRRTAGAIAATDVTLLRLDREVYEKVQHTKYMSKLTERVKRVCNALMRDGLRQIPLFANFSQEMLEDFANLFKFEVLPAGATVCRENDPAERFYIVYHGELVVTMVDNLGFHTEITRVEQNFNFGEDALLKGGRYKASVTTLGSCELFSLGKAEFEIYKEAVLGGSTLATSASDILERHMPVFKHLKLRNQAILGMACQLVTFKQGDVIIEEGTKSNDNIYVLYQGSVKVTQGNKVIRTMKTGYFGEVSLFTDHPNSSTVTASSNLVSCQMIPVNSFRTILLQEPAIYAEIALRVFGKEVNLEHILRHPEAQKSFLTYCAKEYAQENVAFWEEVSYLEDLETRVTDSRVLLALQENPQSVSNRKMNLMTSKCKAICENYIVPGSPSEINISGTTRLELVKKFNAEDFSFSMFEAARTEVFNLIEQDNFARYKESSEFAALLDNIGVYRDQVQQA